jgi:hypothetical protein
MKINEVDPRNYDSDIDYYDALNRAGRKAYQEPEDREPAEPYDAEDDIAQQRQKAAAKFRQKREVSWEPKEEGTAPNGQKYNSRYIINAVDKSTADAEAHSFTDYHWGAKKLVDSEYKQDGDRVELTLYIVDNHKHGMWKPWADEPAQESAEQGVAEGYYDLNDDGMQPIDLSANPSFKQIVNRYTQLVYQGHAGETSPEEDKEYDDIEQYVAKRFGPKGSAHLQKAGETSYWGRDDDRGTGGYRGDNLGRASAPAGNFRTTKAGKMHGQDAKMMKARVADRLGRHPEPNLPEGVAEGFKNTYNVGDRVDGPLGTGVIVAVSPHISTDGRVKVKLDDTSRAGEDGKYKDTFVFDTTQLKHIADEKANPYAIGMAQAMKSTGDKPPLKKSTINKAHEIARAIQKGD